MTPTDSDKPSFSSETHPKRNPAEWITFGIASLVLATIAALVVYLWVARQGEPPVLSVATETVRETDGQFYVPFKIVNKGGETVESIQVVAELRKNGKVEETGEQQIDFLSGGETEEGAFVFSQNPQDGQLVLRVASYKLP